MSHLFSTDEFSKLKDLLIVYECALKTVLTKLDVLTADYKNFQKYNPIEHINSRLKTPISIADKLYRRGLGITVKNVSDYLTDVAGIRVICSFSRDIYHIAEVLKKQPDITVREEKDYISKPKASGYRSYHMIIEIPIFFSNKTVNVPVEIQIRTEAMDFWASLEHKVRYKYNEHIPEHLSAELVVCANKIAELDDRMFLIHEDIALINPEKEEGLQ